MTIPSAKSAPSGTATITEHEAQQDFAGELASAYQAL